MARAVREPIHTFGVGLDEPDANELGYARLVARAIGACHRDVTVTRDEFWAALPSLVWHEDEPIAFPSSVLLHLVSRLARDHVKVVLTGEGADELFLGYNWYRVTAWNERLGRAYALATPAVARRAIRAGIDRLPFPLRRYASRTFLALEPGLRTLFFDSFATFPEGRQRHLLADGESLARRDPYAGWLGAFKTAAGTTLDRMSRADIATYLVELLMKQDQMSMAASIESRVPFLDHKLVEFAARLPDEWKLSGLTTKRVLRESMKGLLPESILNRPKMGVPREVLTRRKMGFPVPVGRWLRGPAWPLVEDLVLGPRALARGLFAPAALRQLADEHRAGTARHGDRLWLLMNLELWHRIFVDGDDVGPAGRAA